MFSEAAPQCRDGILYDTANGQEIQVGTCANGQATASANNSLLRDGIFGCNASKYANIGTLTAVGGIYVPVNDAAVTINTGYLVYKECILDGVVTKISEAARTELAGNILRQLTTARQGRAMYVVNQEEELMSGADQIVLLGVDNANIGSMCPAFKNQVRSAVVRNYLMTRNAPTADLECTAPQSEETTWSSFYALADPANTPVGAYYLLENAIGDSISTYAYNQREQWGWGNGFYAVTDDVENPLAKKVQTPSYLVAQGAGQAVTSGFRCLEGADELSEVCAPMFSGLSTQVISSATGLTGLSQALNGIPSYISQMVGDASTAVRQEAVNAALNILVTSRQVEALYKQAKEGIVNILTNAINKLRGAEKACWDLIIEKVCVSKPGQDNRCPAVGGGTLHVRTSTEFSQAVIDAQIAPIATIAAEDLKKAEAAVKKIEELITAVTNTSSASGQRAALELLDQLVANGLLHTSSQAQNANKQFEDVTTSANQLVEDTLKAWGDSTDPNVGWCNVNNNSVLNMWKDRWKI
ncbi:hypothetical protein HY969_00610 [Candidatus Kaiserbacteria bacterium]|nr:hypothetical protein [Candidatus Kaiserbacteria bacterium]